MYFGELCVGGALLLYVLNYLYGRTRNGMMAQSWLVTVCVHVYSDVQCGGLHFHICILYICAHERNCSHLYSGNGLVWALSAPFQVSIS